MSLQGDAGAIIHISEEDGEIEFAGSVKGGAMSRNGIVASPALCLADRGSTSRD